MFPEHVERSFLDHEYSFDEYFQLGSRGKVGPIKNQLASPNTSNRVREETFFSTVVLRPQTPYGPLGIGSPGRPPRLSHSSWALVTHNVQCSFTSSENVRFGTWSPGRPPRLSDSSSWSSEFLLYVHRDRTGSQGRPPRLSHSSWALKCGLRNIVILRKCIMLKNKKKDVVAILHCAGVLLDMWHAYETERYQQMLPVRSVTLCWKHNWHRWKFWSLALKYSNNCIANETLPPSTFADLQSGSVSSNSKSSHHCTLRKCVTHTNARTHAHTRTHIHKEEEGIHETRHCSSARSPGVGV